MKQLIRGIIIDIIFVLFSIILLKEHSFIFCGIGIIILALLLFKYLNRKK